MLLGSVTFFLLHQEMHLKADLKQRTIGFQYFTLEASPAADDDLGGPGLFPCTGSFGGASAVHQWFSTGMLNRTGSWLPFDW